MTVEASELRELAGETALLLRLDEQRDELGRGHEPHPVVVLAAGHPQGDGQMRLPRTDSADEHDVGGVGDEAAVEDLQYRVAIEVGLYVELEMSFGDGRAEKERAARAAEEALERQVRDLPGSEQRELQSREQTRGLDRGGPSR